MKIWHQLILVLGIGMGRISPVMAATGKNESWLESFGVFGKIAQWGIAILLFVFFIFLGFVVAKIVSSRFRKKHQYEMHKEVPILIERTVYFTILILGGVIAFSMVDIDMTWILGPMTFGLGFAFKDLLSNIIGGMVLLTQKKFKIDDIISVNGKLGRITNIEMRTTDVQSFDGTNLIIPNADMLTNTVQNYTANTFRRLSIQVGVHYATPLPYAIKTSLAALKKHTSILSEPAPEVLTLEFGESSILLELRFWVESSVRWWTIQSEVVQLVKSEFDNAGITIPFPIRTLSLDAYDRNLLKATHIQGDQNPAYSGYTESDLKPQITSKNAAK